VQYKIFWFVLLRTEELIQLGLRIDSKAFKSPKTLFLIFCDSKDVSDVNIFIMRQRFYIFWDQDPKIFHFWFESVCR